MAKVLAAALGSPDIADTFNNDPMYPDSDPLSSLENLGVLSQTHCSRLANMTLTHLMYPHSGRCLYLEEDVP